jgi:DNA-binding NtrC family response regulator
VIELLTRYPWPGNVRELENVVERAVALNISGILTKEDLPAEICEAPAKAALHDNADLLTLEEVEKRHVARVIAAVGANMTRAAEVLGLDRRTLYRMVERFGLNIRETGKP